MLELVAAAITAFVVWTAPAIVMDVPKQCDTVTYARANPGLCGRDDLFPFPRLPSSGGPGDGGIIGRILHGLTGGLL